MTTTRVLLDVAPSPCVTDHLIGLVGHRPYVRLDLGLDNRQIDVLGDLTSLPFEDDSVDVMIAFHVLEHVPDDAAAMSEITRVIGRHGIALLQVPWRPRQPTDEDPDAPADERAERFGQADHVRVYGRDFEARLRNAGLQVARFAADEAFDPATVRDEQLRGRLWFATGVRSDPNEWRALLEAVFQRRRTRAGSPTSTDAARQLAETRRELHHVRRQLRDERARAARVQRELDVAQGSIEALHRSRSYRVSSAILSPVRWARKQIHRTG